MFKKKSLKNKSLKNKSLKNKSLKNKKGILKLEQNIFGSSPEIRNKNFIKKVIKAYKNGYNTIIVDNYPDVDDKYNVKSLMKKTNPSRLEVFFSPYRKSF